jgi:hypothetical protein
MKHSKVIPGIVISRTSHSSESKKLPYKIPGPGLLVVERKTHRISARCVIGQKVKYASHFSNTRDNNIMGLNRGLLKPLLNRL